MNHKNRIERNSGRSFFALLLLSMVSLAAHTEPYLAVQQGFKCIQCHINPTGGGMRNKFGNAFVQTQLAAHAIDTGGEAWLGDINRVLGTGGDLRAAAAVTSIPHQAQSRAFELQQARLYLNAAVIPNRLNVYIDELVAPGAAVNREAYVHYTSRNNQWHLKAGRFYLPFGLRLQDDSAFIRQVAGINMTTPDSGVELGFERNAWSAQFAVSNGSGGGVETDTGKQFSGQVTYVVNRWRLGAAANINESDAGDRHALGLFAGVRTGPVSWLGEVDYVEDDITANAATSDKRKTLAGLLEGNWRVAQGHNLKATAEWFDPNRDVDNDDRARWSLLYEYTPIQFLQLRGGLRYYDGIPQNDLQNRRIYFLELHGFY